jgi:hypothetical protein
MILLPAVVAYLLGRLVGGGGNFFVKYNAVTTDE